MKKLLNPTFRAVAVLLLLGGCLDNGLVDSQQQTAPGGQATSDVRTKDVIFPTQPGERATTYYTDATGTISTAVVNQLYGESSLVGNVTTPLQVPTGYVLVGGGAWTEATWSNGGAYIVTSYPTGISSSSGWVAQSKDHHVFDTHYLRVFAIGLKLEGISESTLRSYMHHSYGAFSSPDTSSPSAWDDVPAGMQLIGGGFESRNWSHGTLLVESFPDAGTQWWARTKDHMYGDPASIRAHTIGITPVIPNFGTLIITGNDDISYAAMGTSGFGIVNASGGSFTHVTTCVGVKSTYAIGDPGRLVCGFAPEFNETGYGNWLGRARSKDLNYPCSGNVRLYLVKVAKL